MGNACYHSVQNLVLCICYRERKKGKCTLNCDSAHCFIFILKVDLTFRKENRLRVFKNSALRKIVGRNWDEVTGDWRRLNNEELPDLYSSPNIVWLIKSQKLRLVLICDTYGGEVYTGIWWGNLKKRPGRHNHKCQDIKMYLKNWLRKLWLDSSGSGR
jgi:hypothetical protein